MAFKRFRTSRLKRLVSWTIGSVCCAIATAILPIAGDSCRSISPSYPLAVFYHLLLEPQPVVRAAEPSAGPFPGSLRASPGVGGSASTPSSVSRWLTELRDSAEKLNPWARSKKPSSFSEAAKTDPISLSRPSRPSAQLYVAMARLAEQQGRFEEAESYYREALRISPRELSALLGYARLKERMRDPEKAAELYGQAVQNHRQDPAVYNDYALFMARRGRFAEAARIMERAIQLQPRRWLYRNNMAMILVDLGDVSGALQHLLAVQDEATAYYNVGYLLIRKGDKDAAIRYLAIALEKNPQLREAQVWLNALAGEQVPSAPMPEYPAPPAFPDDLPPISASAPTPPSTVLQDSHGGLRPDSLPPPPMHSPPPRTGWFPQNVRQIPAPGVRRNSPGLLYR